MNKDEILNILDGNRLYQFTQTGVDPNSVEFKYSYRITKGIGKLIGSEFIQCEETECKETPKPGIRCLISDNLEDLTYTLQEISEGSEYFLDHILTFKRIDDTWGFIGTDSEGKVPYGYEIGNANYYLYSLEGLDINKPKITFMKRGRRRS